MEATGRTVFVDERDPTGMRRSRWWLGALTILGVAGPLVRPLRNAVGPALDVLLDPLLDPVGVQVTALVAAVCVGLLVAATLHLLGSSATTAEQALAAAAIASFGVGSWFVWALGLTPFLGFAPDIVVPFVVRIPFTDSTLLLYFAIHLLAIAAFAAGAVALSTVAPGFGDDGAVSSP